MRRASAGRLHRNRDGIVAAVRRGPLTTRLAPDSRRQECCRFRTLPSSGLYRLLR